MAKVRLGVLKVKKDGKKPEKRKRPTREEKEKYVLDLIQQYGSLAFAELWQVAKSEKESPFRGMSESTFRRTVKSLAKQSTLVSLLKGPKKKALIVEDPAVTAANAEGDKSNPSEPKVISKGDVGAAPASAHDSYNDQVAGAAPAGSPAAVLAAENLDNLEICEMARRFVEELDKREGKPRERVKTEYEIEVEIGSLGLAVGCARAELQRRERALEIFELVVKNRNLIFTTEPLPEESTPKEPPKPAAASPQPPNKMTIGY